MDTTELLSKLLEGAEAHGINSHEPGHEVGDLQEILSSCWAEMSDEQRNKVYEQHKGIVEENI